ncbi:MAG: phosphoribosylglycinamide formyltransferase [Candidatus Margulisiibacteriota bacterium]|jgi:phosphoribosylglycinamide formyltransferase-1
MLRIGALISGRGSNLQAVLDACKDKRITGEIKVVISNKAAAFGLERARQAGIEALHLTSENQIITALKEKKIDLVILAGFMKIISPKFIAEFRNKILNIHPALLPAFPGLHAQQQAIAYGAKVSGATVHFVDEGMDTGPVILQEAVPVQETDTADTLAGRIIKVEHQLYPRAIQLFAEGRLKIEGRKVIIKEK